MRFSKFFPLGVLVLVSTTLMIAPNHKVQSQENSEKVRDKTPMPVSVAKNGFTAKQAAELKASYSYEESLKGGDLSLHMLLRNSEYFPSAVVPRSGTVSMLESAPDPAIGKLTYTRKGGETTLDQYLAGPESRAQAMIVVHKGKIVFETYPGMRDFDYHLWASCAKPTTALVLANLQADGKFDPRQTVGHYVPALRNSAWENIPVQDVLDMASGLDVEENPSTRGDPKAVMSRLLKAEAGLRNSEGKIETTLELAKAATRLRPPGESFEYSSMNTQILVLVAEAITDTPWTELFRSQVWSKMTNEGDALVTVTPDGVAVAHGVVISRLRDLARYGMLYTPSWIKAARERVVSDKHLEQIQKGGRPNIYSVGNFGKRMNGSFAGDKPVANSMQWDAVFDDGDFFKSGVMGQGLYVSPGKDLVVVWFSTVPATDLTHYARLIARAYAEGK